MMRRYTGSGHSYLGGRCLRPSILYMAAVETLKGERTVALEHFSAGSEQNTLERRSILILLFLMQGVFLSYS